MFVIFSVVIWRDKLCLTFFLFLYRVSITIFAFSRYFGLRRRHVTYCRSTVRVSKSSNRLGFSPFISVFSSHFKFQSMWWFADRTGWPDTYNNCLKWKWAELPRILLGHELGNGCVHDTGFHQMEKRGTVDKVRRISPAKYQDLALRCIANANRNV